MASPFAGGPPIWLLTTRGRPDLCLKAVEAAYKQAERPFHLEVYVDELDGGYRPVQKLVEREGGVFHVEPKGGGLAHSNQWCLERHPNASQYGWLADDTFPRTLGCNRKLEEATGDWFVSYANDLWLIRQSDSHRKAIESGALMTSGLCFGGKLVRAVGAWAIPPGVKQAAIDETWCYLIRRLFCWQYVPSVTVEHWNWRTGKRRKDKTDLWTRPGLGDYCAQDCKIANKWQRDGSLDETANRVVEAMILDGFIPNEHVKELYEAMRVVRQPAARFAGQQRRQREELKKAKERVEAAREIYQRSLDGKEEKGDVKVASREEGAQRRRHGRSREEFFQDRSQGR